MQPHPTNPGKNEQHKWRATLSRVWVVLSMHRVDLIILGVLVVWMCGCTAQNPTGAPADQAAQTASAPTPGLVNPAIVTATRLPTLTPTATLIPSPTPSATPTAIPTLSPESALTRTLELLATNGGCQLPCLWGITPGQTSAQLAWDYFFPLSSISEDTEFWRGLGTIAPVYDVEDGFEFKFRVSFVENNNIANSIYFTARALKVIDEGENRGAEAVYTSTLFGSQLQYYMLANILNENGAPESVLLSTLAEFPSYRYGQGHFQIILLYPGQGIFVHYTTEMQVVGENVIGCPANAHVELMLFPSGNKDEFINLLAPSGWVELMKSFEPIEAVTSMSIEEFYQMFRSQPEACIQTPSTYWPVPER